MLIKTLLNRIERFKSYVYEDTRLEKVGGLFALVVSVLPRKNAKPICGVCGQKGSIHDTRTYLPGVFSQDFSVRL